MKFKADDIFTEQVIDTIISEIDGNSGYEVLFVGNIDRSGKVIEIEAIAWGNQDSAPVVMMDAVRGDVLIHNHPSGDLTPSAPDINLSTLLANRKIGFYIIDNNCTNVNVVLKPSARIYLNEDEIRGIFAEQGLLSKAITNFEVRDEQIEMVDGVVNAVNNSQILICEAGTGTGKSLSYLIPSAVWAIQNKKRVVVSTYTINLQQQIAHKDMAIVENVIKSYLGDKVISAVLLGKGNYLCRKRLYNLIKDRDMQATLFETDAERELIQDIEQWSRNAEEGTRSEYGEMIKQEIWEEIACDTMSCTRKQCQYYGKCFYYAARLRAERAHILIANHSLVFSSIDDISYYNLLPFYSGIVFDEAHHVEDVALHSLSRDLSFQGIFYNLRKLYQKKTERGKKKELGLLVLLKIKADLDKYIDFQVQHNKLIAYANNLNDMVNETYEQISQLLRRERENGSIGIDEDYLRTDEYKLLRKKMKSLFRKINRFTIKLESLCNEISEQIKTEPVLEVIRSITARKASLTEMSDTCNTIFSGELSPEYARWIEISKKNIRFSLTPLEVGNFIAGSLLAKKDFSIFTSATLMVDKKFDYFKSGVGIELVHTKQLVELALPSPFDYKNQAEIYVPQDVFNHRELTSEKIDFVRDMCLISEGGALVLFTSYTRLGQMFAELSSQLLENGLLPLKQGERSRKQLLETMNQHHYGVLFATSSFWEGIDIPGDNLRCVIIEKLPFDNPNEPIFNAKVKLLQSRGIDAFITYSLPRAVLRLKQGLGRLIRSKTDKGVIAILDNRIRTQPYGRIFQDSLPPARLIYAPTRRLTSQAKRFFAERFSKD